MFMLCEGRVRSIQAPCTLLSSNLHTHLPLYSVDLNARMSLFQRDSDQRFDTRIWLDYENKTSVNETKKNGNT